MQSLPNKPKEERYLTIYLKLKQIANKLQNQNFESTDLHKLMNSKFLPLKSKSNMLLKHFCLNTFILEYDTVFRKLNG